MTIRRLLAELGPGEFQFWYLSDSFDPIGQWRQDAQGARVAAEVFNKGIDPGHWISPAEFMPRYDQALIEGSPDDPGRRLMNIRAAVTAMRGQR